MQDTPPPRKRRKKQGQKDPLQSGDDKKGARRISPCTAHECPLVSTARDALPAQPEDPRMSSLVTVLYQRFSAR
jgi:hypothetical protein